jgi:hypothetical protein
MLISLFSTVALLSAETSSNAIARPKDAKGYPTARISVTTWDGLRSTFTDHEITAGTSQRRVLAWLGAPRRELAPGLVVYENCEPDQKVAENCKDLIITFRDGKVESMVFGNAPMTDLIASNAQKEQQPEKQTIIALASLDSQD